MSHDGIVSVPVEDLSALAHNVIVLRYVERHARFDRMLSILEMRDSDFDRGIRELQITSRGIELAHEPHSARQVLPVVVHEPSFDPLAGRDDGGRKAAKSRHQR